MEIKRKIRVIVKLEGFNGVFCLSVLKEEKKKKRKKENATSEHQKEWYKHRLKS